MKKFWNFIQNEDTSETELLFNGPISEDTWWGDEVTPALFRDELAKVSGNLTVWLNSPGGDVFAASQIYSMLKSHKGKVTVKIDGIAASAASVVAMAGDETLIAPTALMMIHDPSTCAMGNKADMEKAIILLDEVKESIINAYETKSHLSRNKIAKLMSDETWLNAKKAHEMGFVDGILFAEKKKSVPEKGTEPDKKEPDEEKTEKEDSLTAMTYSKLKNLSAFLSKVSASAEPVKGTPIDQLEKRLSLLKY
ncbi:MAG: Clp protease ClpP [Ruminococcus callidus]|uniref:head maturation protease, ClpP-related n=1 Tax=Ruminococcus callidus TaxID=40519 RepID=UPI002E76DEFB|nr:head maturation protease, ClpP-related [Ruminococcus callidus]MEE0505344.1 Clp protease ClpP [Ruminococcus callidus]